MEPEFNEEQARDFFKTVCLSLSYHQHHSIKIPLWLMRLCEWSNDQLQHLLHLHLIWCHTRSSKGARPSLILSWISSSYAGPPQRCQPVASLLLSRILSNFRPIALTSCVGKLFTTIMDIGGCHLCLRMGTLTRQLQRHLCLSPQGASSTKQAGFHHPKHKEETKITGSVLVGSY